MHGTVHALWLIHFLFSSIPSASCCCPSGLTHVTANSSSPRSLDVQTALAGTGFSCLQKDGDVRMTFNLLNSTTAEASPEFASAPLLPLSLLCLPLVATADCPLSW